MKIKIETFTDQERGRIVAYVAIIEEDTLLASGHSTRTTGNEPERTLNEHVTRATEYALKSLEMSARRAREHAVELGLVKA